MKVKTSELIDHALDFAVAKALMKTHFSHMPSSKHWWSPSTNWNHGGPIIEREGGMLWSRNGNTWGFKAKYNYAEDKEGVEKYGPTPLIAAMRAFVASRLGDEVEIPEELL